MYRIYVKTPNREKTSLVTYDILIYLAEMKGVSVRRLGYNRSRTYDYIEFECKRKRAKKIAKDLTEWRGPILLELANEWKEPE